MQLSVKPNTTVKFQSDIIIFGYSTNDLVHLLMTNVFHRQATSGANAMEKNHTLPSKHQKEQTIKFTVAKFQEMPHLDHAICKFSYVDSWYLKC